MYHKQLLQIFEQTSVDKRKSKRIIYTMWEYNRVTQNATGWAKKSKPDNFCNNFVYCQPIFIIFGTYTL